MANLVNSCSSLFMSWFEAEVMLEVKSRPSLLSASTDNSSEMSCILLLQLLKWIIISEINCWACKLLNSDPNSASLIPMLWSTSLHSESQSTWTRHVLKFSWCPWKALLQKISKVIKKWFHLNLMHMSSRFDQNFTQSWNYEFHSNSLSEGMSWGSGKILMPYAFGLVVPIFERM